MISPCFDFCDRPLGLNKSSFYRSTVEVRIFLLAILAVVIGLGLLYFGFSSFRTRRLIENTPTSKVRSLAMGFVEVYGMVVPFGKQILLAPFSRKDCVYYRYVIERYETNRKGGGHWVTVQQGSESVPFSLKDATGSVLVDPQGAHVDAPQSVVLQSGFGVDPPKHVQGYLQKRGVSFEGLLGINHKMRYREEALFPNQNVYIMGTAGDNPGVAEGSGKKNEDDIMIAKGHNFYYISPKSEKEVLNSFMWKIVLGLVLGSLLFLLGLIGIFLYLKIL